MAVKCMSEGKYSTVLFVCVGCGEDHWATGFGRAFQQAGLRSVGWQ